MDVGHQLFSWLWKSPRLTHRATLAFIRCRFLATRGICFHYSHCLSVRFGFHQLLRKNTSVILQLLMSDLLFPRIVNLWLVLSWLCTGGKSEHPCWKQLPPAAGNRVNKNCWNGTYIKFTGCETKMKLKGAKKAAEFIPCSPHDKQFSHVAQEMGDLMDHRRFFLILIVILCLCLPPQRSNIEKKKRKTQQLCKSQTHGCHNLREEGRGARGGGEWQITSVHKALPQ